MPDGGWHLVRPGDFVGPVCDSATGHAITLQRFLSHA
jgi:uncharacterized cupin superfamily protein